MTGIYKITNMINNKCYIGQARDIQARWDKHLSTLYSTNTPDYKIYRAINKYGINNFTFSIIEECNVSQLNEREIYWINYYDSYNNGYNMTLGGEACNGTNDKPVYQYALDGTFIKKYKSAHEAERETGISFPNICKVCRGERKTAGDYAWFYTERQETGPIYTTVKHNTPVIQYDLNGNKIAEYPSAKEAYYQTGINNTSIGLVCKGKQKTAGKYIWKYKTEEI